MKKTVITFIVSLFIVGCGGSSSEDSKSAVAGVWKGLVTLGGQYCGDGSFIGAGSGTIVGEIELLVSGSDLLDSVVDVKDGNCILEGKRTVSGFVAYPVSGCDANLVSVAFVIKSEGLANYNYAYNVSNIPAQTCIGQSGAEIKREDR